ncbi:MAG TPA: hypothetical protein VJO32_10040 [Ktedonobacteraceae bacterium]|nr:hypothetical protein [Ktedonobacteraceae bacterium]
MRDIYDESRYYRDNLPRYQEPRRPGRGLLYLFFFVLGVITTIALSFVISPALLQAFLELFIQVAGFLIQALFEAIVWLLMHPPVFMLSVTFVMILVIIRLLRQRGRWR